jgi:predicted acyl esterase
MHRIARACRLALLTLAASALLLVAPPAARSAEQAAPPPPPPATYSELPSETPAKFEPVTESFDYVKHDLMIPMRDGVKLHTVILVPKGARGTTTPPT